MEGNVRVLFWLYRSKVNSKEFSNDTGRIQIFPFKKDKNEKLLSEAIDFGPYSPSPMFTSGKGIHPVGISFKTPGRGIGYLYVEILSNGERIEYLKIPSIVAWR